MTKAVNPIPQQYRSITPNLVCRNADAAIDFYKKAFGATEVMRMPGPNNVVLHAELKIGDSLIFVNDPMGPGQGASSPATNPISLHLYTQDADAVFNRAVSLGAHVDMPLENQFWGDRYGRLTDPFGQQWGIATHVEDLTAEEIAKRQKEFMARAARQS